MPTETQSLIARIAGALNITSGPRFFELLAEQLAGILGADYVAVIEKTANGERLLARVGRDDRRDGISHVPLVGSNGRILGEIAVSQVAPPNPDQSLRDALKIFGARASAELERKQTEESLCLSEQRYHEFIAHSMEGVWRIEFNPPVPLDLSEDQVLERILHDGRTVEYNDALKRMNGVPDEEQVVGWRLIDTPNIEGRVDILRRQIRGGFKTRTFQFSGHTRSGDVAWFEQLQVPIMEDGTLVRAWGITRDITKAKLAEEAVREAEERYHGLFEAAGEAILVSQKDVVDCNARALRLFGANREQILNGHAWEYSPDFQPDGSNSRELVQRRTELALRGISSSFDWQYRRMDGTLFDGHVTLSPVMIEGVAHRVALIRDITERKKAERQIQELNTELERLVEQRTSQLELANRELEAFSYSVSHDVRAAIRGIYACSKIVLDDYGERLNSAGARWLHAICNDSLQLDRVTKELLELSRLGRARLDREEVDLSAMAWASAQRISEAQPQRQACFRIAEGMSALADEALLRVVLDHLLGNAWKFTRTREAAEIEVGAMPGSSSNIVFFVRDNGVGFQSHKAGQLFNAFARLHSPEEFEGTGIGLATVRRLIHRHGGRVWAEGSEGLGATIFFTLPRSTDG